ncbi:MAG TPA: glycosyltransferase family 2 protein [bacterium]|jgi:hypothetical protein
MTKISKNTSSVAVTALVITFAPPGDVLSRCLDSLRRQDPRPHIIIADNFSLTDPKHEIADSFQARDCSVVTFDRNYGFGGAINRVLPEIKSRYILISNFDIIYDPKYIAFAVWRLEQAENNVVGIAGKTLFYPPNADENWPGAGPGDDRPETGKGTGAVIDNVGTLVNGLMLAYNRGIGQIDIGQYDVPDRPMGACFAAFFAKTDSFDPIENGGAGLLDESYFMYYEDIDWCYRANILGKEIHYEPRAIAWHHHSLTTRNLSVFFKYHLIQRNLYRTIIRNMKFRTAVKLHAFHARMHIRRARVEKIFAPVTWKILWEMLLWTPIGLFRRTPIQRYRKKTDTEIINLSIGEEGHLDDLSLRPKADWKNVNASIERLSRLFPEDPAAEIAPYAKQLADGKGTLELSDRVQKMIQERCSGLSRLIKIIRKP